MNSKLADLYATKILNEKVEEPTHSEKDMSNPEERKEVKIGKQIIKAVQECETSDKSYAKTLREIKTLAQELIYMHTK